MHYQQLNLNDFNTMNQTDGADVHLRASGAIDMDYYVARAQSVRAAETAAHLRSIKQAVLRLFA